MIKAINRYKQLNEKQLLLITTELANNCYEPQSADLEKQRW